MEIFNEANFQDKVIGSTQPVLVDFWRPSCGPCNRLTPILDKLSKEFAGKVLFGKVNTDENEDLTAAHNVSAVPMMFLFKDGKVVRKILGLQNENTIRNELNELLS
jgi:thioredoxin 1